MILVIIHPCVVLVRAAKYEVEYVEQALEEATTLFARTGDLQLAATSCLELAEFYMDQQDLRGALRTFRRAAGYCGYKHRNCGHKADVVGSLLRDEEALRRWGVLPLSRTTRGGPPGTSGRRTQTGAPKCATCSFQRLRRWISQSLCDG
ncbi:uncharacterized protein [Triticum aestivum]|uniref:uncharacterized protein isoform X1 n=1 Tax=Triticum aestivum TaxID=4565 RepID=UPI001D01FE4F|nr:uncharacterized protein LOC123149375 isoform X1 [Triticum aestivum]